MSESSLREYDRPADRIRLHRQVSSKPLIVVEGLSDERVCSRLIGAGVVEVFIVGTRGVVLEVAGELSRLAMMGVACVVDRDFDDEVAAVEGPDSPVVAYDNGDLEAMLIMSEAFSFLLGEVASAVKLSNHGGASEVRRVVVESCSTIAKVRQANAANLWGLKFDGVDVAARVKVSDASINIGPFCDALLTISEYSSATRSMLLRAAQGDHLICPVSGDIQFRGRDALAIVGVLLRRRIGSLKHEESHYERLERSLRLAVQRSDIEGTAWWSRMTDRLGLAA